MLSDTATDSRDQETTAQDLKKSSMTEETLIQRFIKQHTGLNLEPVHLGGSRGNPVGNVDVRPDFKLVEAMEVKHANPHYEEWSSDLLKVKTENLKACKYHKAQIMFVHNLQGDNPQYSLLDPMDFLKNGVKTGYHDTPAYGLRPEEFDWRDF